MKQDPMVIPWDHGHSMGGIPRGPTAVPGGRGTGAAGFMWLSLTPRSTTEYGCKKGLIWLSKLGSYLSQMPTSVIYKMA